VVAAGWLACRRHLALRPGRRSVRPPPT